MRILAFDTATRATTVALAGGGETVLEGRDDPLPGQRPGHVSRLLPLVAEVMERGGIEFADLDRIAVGVGPGTFTGLRIGIATARGLAQAASLRLVGVSTLRSLALAAAQAPETVDSEAICAVIDARRGEVFAAAWRSSGDAVFGARALAPEALADALRQTGLRSLAVGDGAIEFRGVIERSGAVIPEDDSELHRVTATAHLRIAAQLPGVSPDQIHPEYLRDPDAKEPRFHPAAGRP
jgi:tRNA threonylcarbamoyladenosine biosynthesis protein TsaB